MVTGLPTTTKAPPPSQKWVEGKQVGGGVYIPCDWKLADNNDPSTLQETVALIKGALKEVDEEGVVEVEVSQDFLYIMFNSSHQILLIFYKCQIHNTISPCAVQNINLKQEKCHTLPNQSVYLINVSTNCMS